jgi:hypothetical protein
MLAELLDIDDVTAGAIDASSEKTIGVYQRGEFVPRECVGTDSSFETSKVRLLLRWGKNPTTAEAKAAELGELMQALRDAETTAHMIKFADVKAVRAIGKDEKGVCEYVVDADIIYTRKE